LMIVALLGAIVGLLIDPRVITGAPAWLKPAKFAVSVGIYTFTLAWMFRYLTAWPRVRRIAGWVTAVTLVLEIVLINLQAWRGTSSHFNIGAPLDGIIFGVMGVAILVQTLAAVAVTVASWRQPFADRALGWAIRLGLALSIAGASVGGIMTQPTAAQLAEARVSQRLPIAGAHTVGAPDGGPGLPGTGWSVEYGDLRIPHFVGIHALQALPLLALVFGRVRFGRAGGDAERVRLTLTAAASYAAIFGILLWQALAGQSLVRPDLTTLSALAVWAAATLLALRAAAPRRMQVGSPTMV
jgi:hypothetical protein